MITLGQKLEILRQHFIDGKAKKEIAREMHISKNTVKSYINDFKESKQELLNAGVSRYELIENMVESPKYNTSSRKATVLTDEIKELIHVYIKRNEEKILSGRKKQLMTAQDMHEELLESGYQLSYTTVAQYVQKYKESESTYEAFIKQYYENGEVCEFDWGEVKLIIDKCEVKIKMAVFTLAKSGMRFSFLYRHENTESFVDAHIRFFNFINGVPKIMVYDNMKVAVARFVGRTEKEATEALKKISLYYGFKFRFCNINAGNEKGHVENSVDFIRRKAFSSKDDFPDLNHAQARLKERVEKHNNLKTKYQNGLSPMDMFAEESKHLLKLMPEYVNCSSITARVDKLSTISYSQNRYSVPDYLVRKVVEVRVYVSKVDIYDNDKKAASHKRLTGNHLWSIDIFHYTKTLSQKPGALPGSVAFNQMSEFFKNVYDKHFKNENQSFIELLSLVKAHEPRDIEQVVKKLEDKHIVVSLDNIKLLLNRNEQPKDKDRIGNSDMQNEIEKISRQHLAAYDIAIGTSNISEVESI